jgi:hypothetical protein
VLDAFIIEDIRRREREKEESTRLPLRPPEPSPVRSLPPPPKEKERRSGIVDFTLMGKVVGTGGRDAYL